MFLLHRRAAQYPYRAPCGSWRYIVIIAEKAEKGKEREIMMDKEYIYTVVKEDFRTGERAKRTRKYYTFKPLAVGGLYTHLGKGYPGCQRVLGVEERLLPAGD